MSLGFDPFFECVHKHFLVSLAECDNALLEIFTRFDADGDGLIRCVRVLRVMCESLLHLFACEVKKTSQATSQATDLF